LFFYNNADKKDKTKQKKELIKENINLLLQKNQL